MLEVSLLHFRTGETEAGGHKVLCSKLFTQMLAEPDWYQMGRFFWLSLMSNPPSLETEVAERMAGKGQKMCGKPNTISP